MMFLMIHQQNDKFAEYDLLIKNVSFCCQIFSSTLESFTFLDSLAIILFISCTIAMLLSFSTTWKHKTHLTKAKACQGMETQKLSIWKSPSPFEIKNFAERSLPILNIWHFAQRNIANIYFYYTYSIYLIIYVGIPLTL